MEFTFYNPGGELTFSGDGITYSYIGRASLVSVAQAGTGAVSRGAGQSTYTITWAGDILVALPVKANGTTALINTSQSGSVWTITVHKGNGSSDSKALDIQEATEVYVFGAPPVNVTPTFMFYDVNGVPCADLSRQPLTYKARLSMGSGVIEWTPPVSVVTPAVIGWPQDYKAASTPNSGFFDTYAYARGWQLGPGGVIQRNPYTVRWTQSDGGVSPEDIIRPIDGILIDAAGLN